jgi:hypothetical protein
MSTTVLGIYMPVFYDVRLGVTTIPFMLDNRKRFHKKPLSLAQML